jgi:hypothetical protein
MTPLILLAQCKHARVINRRENERDYDKQVLDQILYAQLPLAGSMVSQSKAIQIPFVSYLVVTQDYFCSILKKGTWITHCFL